MRTERTNRRRDKNRHSELDWFAEDPWGEPGLAAFDDKDDDDDYAGMWGQSEDSEDEDWTLHEDGDEWNEDAHDGWGAIRSRRKRPGRRG